MSDSNECNRTIQMNIAALNRKKVCGNHGVLVFLWIHLRTFLTNMYLLLYLLCNLRNYIYIYVIIDQEDKHLCLTYTFNEHK